MNYVRDKRSPKPSSPLASKVMSAIKAKNTIPEVVLRQLLWKGGLRGYRLHWRTDGKPDIAFVKYKIAIFIHGCYWHRCPNCDLPLPKSNREFWKRKFETNVSRDQAKTKTLKRRGWYVITIWECELKTIPTKVLKRVNKALKTRL